MPPTEKHFCPVCEWHLSRAPHSVGEHSHFDCPRCGSFIFDRSALDDLPSVLRTDKQRAALSYSIRRAQRDGQTPQYLYAQIELILQLAFLPSAHEQADNLIRWLGDAADGPGVAINVNARDQGAIAGSLLSIESFDFLIREMLNSGLLDGTRRRWSYINPDGGTTIQSDGMAHVTLSFAGWRRYEELKRGSASGNIAFMAMQYQDSELDGIVNVILAPPYP